MQHIDLQMEEAHQPLSMNPKKFIVWLFMVSIFMMFAGWTSYFLVARGEGILLDMQLPTLFKVNTVLLLVSSITIHLALVATRKDNLLIVKLLLGITFLLGVAFLFGQWFAFDKLLENDIHFVNANSLQSMVYLLPFMHGLHIIAGLIFVAIVLFMSYRYKVHSRNMAWLEMCATFWHFLDALWIYLFLFLTLNT